MPIPLRVLFVEDNEADTLLMARELGKAGYEVISEQVSDETTYLSQLSPEWDLILCDYYLPAFSQETALELLNKRGWDIPFIVISNAYNEDRSIKAIQGGAADWLLKDNFNKLGATVQKALERRQARQQKKKADYRNASFSLLGQRLSLARTPQDAAEIIAKISDKLFGWDAFSFECYSAKTGSLQRILNVDTLEGKRVPVFPNFPWTQPTARQKKALEEGAQLILRQPPFLVPPDAVPFGDVHRASASIICVPVRNGNEVVGFMSVQSYRPHAYDAETVDLLQAMADFCGGALERLRTEEILRKSEERYRSLVAATSQMVWTTATDGQVVEDSPTWRGYTGQTWEEYKGWGWILALHPRDVDPTLELWKTALAERSLLQTEFRVRSADGNYRHFGVRGAPVVDQQGSIREWVATCTDITDAKRAERRNEAFLQLAQKLNLSRTPEEAARNILHEAEKLFGWDSGYVCLYSARENLIRRLIAMDTIHGTKTAVKLNSPTQPSQIVSRVIKEGSELILRNNPEQQTDVLLFGSKRPSASLMFVPMRNGEQVIGLLSLQSYTQNAYDHEDLSTLQALADFCGGLFERLRIEEAHHESEERFRMLVEQAADAILVFDEAGRIIDVNQRACQTLGYSHQELVTLNISDVDAKFAELRQGDVWKTMLVGEPVSFNSTHMRKDGCSFTVEIRAGLFEFKGQKLCIALARDATERLQLEHQLRQAQKMEAFGQLAGGVAHDFNNLLTVISGYTNLMLSNDQLDSETAEQLQEIQSAAEKATNLTRQLLTLSRKKEIHEESVNLMDVLTNMGKILKRIIGEDIHFDVQYASDLPPVQADVGMMEQVLLNLAVNARDAMPDGGELSMKIEPVQISQSYTLKNPEARPGEFVCMQVRDSGCGMPSEVCNRVFEPFFTTKGRKGTGLGLATVYSIVKQHRGWVEVSSEVGKGTEFKVFLPLSEQTPTNTKVKIVEPMTDGGSETILLVEDEAALRSLARQILQRKGYRVLEAESGLKALTVWENHSTEIDLLLTDMVMPDGINGRDLAQRLRASRPELKVIYTSGYSMALESFECELREGWNFLQKPYHPGKLTKAIRDRLNERTVAA